MHYVVKNIDWTVNVVKLACEKCIIVSLLKLVVIVAGEICYAMRICNGYKFAAGFWHKMLTLKFQVNKLQFIFI